MGTPIEDRGELYQGLTLKERKILDVFRHWVYRNHSYSEDCDGCVDAAAWLVVPGYNGEMSHPQIG